MAGSVGRGSAVPGRPRVDGRRQLSDDRDATSDQRVRGSRPTRRSRRSEFSLLSTGATGRAKEPPMITVSGLTKKYGDRTVVDQVSFDLEPGTVTGFLGPNGAGKTTTMRMMTSLVAPTAGSAVIDGKLYAELPNPGAVVGTLLDASAVHPGRTGRTHLRLLASAVGVPASRVDEVLGMVGLADAANRRIGGYSLGMRQRLGVAGGLLAGPPGVGVGGPAHRPGPGGLPGVGGPLPGAA